MVYLFSPSQDGISLHKPEREEPLPPPRFPPKDSHGEKLFKVHRMGKEGVKLWMNSPGWTGLGWKTLLLNAENLGQSCLCEDINHWHFKKHVNWSDISVFSLNHIGPQGPLIPTNFSPFKLKKINLNCHVGYKQQHTGVPCFSLVAAAPEIFHIFKKHWVNWVATWETSNRGEPSRYSFESCLFFSFSHINTG